MLMLSQNLQMEQQRRCIAFLLPFFRGNILLPLAATVWFNYKAQVPFKAILRERFKYANNLWLPAITAKTSYDLR